VTENGIFEYVKFFRGIVSYMVIAFTILIICAFYYRN